MRNCCVLLQPHPRGVGGPGSILLFTALRTAHPAPHCEQRCQNSASAQSTALHRGSSLPTQPVLWVQSPQQVADIRTPGTLSPLPGPGSAPCPPAQALGFMQAPKIPLCQKEEWIKKVSERSWWMGYGHPRAFEL